MIKSGAIEDLAVSRAEKAILAGADGVIASPKELKLLRKRERLENVVHLWHRMGFEITP